MPTTPSPIDFADTVQYGFDCPTRIATALARKASEHGMCLGDYATFVAIRGIQRELGNVPPTLDQYRAMRGGGFVYLMSAENGLHKIGRSRNPSQRRSMVQVDARCAVDIVHTIKCSDPVAAERAAHAMFADKRRHGEWFALTSEDVRRFKALDAAALCGSEVGK